MLLSLSSSCLRKEASIVSQRDASKLISRLTGSTSSNIATTFNRPRRTVVSYAAVNHAQEYKDQMNGRHGQQLRLAIREGHEKSDGTHFNPFEAYAVPESTEDAVIADEGREGEYATEENSDEDSDADSSFEDEELEEDDSPSLSEFQSLYHPDGSLRSLTPAMKNSFRAGLPAGESFAVIQLAGSQHKVTVDDVLIVSKLKPVDVFEVGSTHILTDDSVLLMGDRDKTLVGLPYVRGGEVEVMVEEITRDKTIDVFKKRRRKNSRRKNGFRRQVTFLRILNIRFPENETEKLATAA